MSVAGIGQASNLFASGAVGAATSLAGAAAKPDAKAEFLKWAHMTPAERMRANLLSSMGLTEDQVAAMSPEDRKKVEDKLRELIEQKVKENVERPGQLVDRKV